TVLNLVRAVLDTRERVRNQVGKSGRERIDGTAPIILRWFGKEDFFSCCADQLLRLETPKRLVLSYCKAIDSDDHARKVLAAALISRAPSLPASVREHEGLEESYETLRLFDDYCRKQSCGAPSKGPKIPLLTYLTVLENLDRSELATIIGAMKDAYRI